MKVRHFFATVAAVLACTAPVSHPASAREQLTDAEMDDARGGILVAGGVAFEFGAVVKTFEDGVLKLQTQVTLTPNGPLIEQTVGQNVSQLTDQLLAQLNGAGAVSDSDLAKNGFVTDTGAVILQQLSQGQILNLLINTDSNRTFRQDTDITITLPGFSSVQAEATRQLTGIHLADDLHAVMIGAN